MTTLVVPEAARTSLQGTVCSGRVLCPFARCSLRTNERYTPQLSARRLKRHSLHDEGDLRLPAGEYNTAKLASIVLFLNAPSLSFLVQRGGCRYHVQLTSWPHSPGLPTHLQAVLGGNSSPSKDDITSILGSGACSLFLSRAWR